MITPSPTSSKETESSQPNQGLKDLNGSVRNNDELRQIVKAIGLRDAGAMTIFNRGLGARSVTMTQWKAFLNPESSANFEILSDELLAHARQVFAPMVSAA